MTSILNNLDANTSLITQALEIQRRVATVGFEWPSILEAIAKAHEELDELSAELSVPVHAQDPQKILIEYGDVLLMMMNIANRLQLNPELALQQANDKFIKRFKSVENKLQDLNKTPATSSLEEMEAFWQEVKSEE